MRRSRPGWRSGDGTWTNPLHRKEFAVNEKYFNPHPVYQEIEEWCESVDSSAPVGLRGRDQRHGIGLGALCRVGCHCDAPNHARARQPVRRLRLRLQRPRSAPHRCEAR